MPAVRFLPDLARAQGVLEVDFQGLGAGFLERPEGIEVLQTGPLIESLQVRALSGRKCHPGNGDGIPLPDEFKVHAHRKSGFRKGQCGMAVAVRQADRNSGPGRDASQQGPADHPVKPATLATQACPSGLIFAGLFGGIEQGGSGRSRQPDGDGAGSLGEVDQRHLAGSDAIGLARADYA